MRGDYALEPLYYSTHCKGVQCFDLIEAPSAKYVGKDTSHGTGLSKLYPGSSCQLIDSQEVQNYIHTMGTRKMIRWTNFVYICLLYRLCKNQEKNQQNRTRIRP